MEQAARIFDLDEAYDFLGAGPGSAEAASSIAARWQSLDEAGRVVAGLAGEREPAEAQSFAAWLGSTGGARQDAARRGVDDLAAIMEPGLAALLYVCENGGDARAPAAALWREYSEARTALLALAALAPA